MKPKKNQSPQSELATSGEKSADRRSQNPEEDILYDPAFDRVREYAERLRRGRSFLNLVLIHVATGINQHRLRQLRSQVKGDSDLINLYNETEKIGALQRQAIARLEKLFKSVLKQASFWERTAQWIVTRLDQWALDARMPVDCSIPGVLSIEADPALPEEEGWRESIVMSACAFYTASEWLRHLDLSAFSIEDIEKLLGIRSSDTLVNELLHPRGMSISLCQR